MSTKLIAISFIILTLHVWLGASGLSIRQVSSGGGVGAACADPVFSGCGRGPFKDPNFGVCNVNPTLPGLIQDSAGIYRYNCTYICDGGSSGSGASVIRAQYDVSMITRSSFRELLSFGD